MNTLTPGVVLYLLLAPRVQFTDGNTSDSVLKNIAHLCGRTKSKMWGPDGWKKVVVCVVSDGRSKINKRTLQVLTLVSTVLPEALL